MLGQWLELAFACELTANKETTAKKISYRAAAAVVFIASEKQLTGGSMT